MSENPVWKEKERGRKSLPILLLYLLIFISSHVWASPNKSLQPGEAFPDFSLPIPKSPNEKLYPGISGEGIFKLP